MDQTPVLTLCHEIELILFCLIIFFFIENLPDSERLWVINNFVIKINGFAKLLIFRDRLRDLVLFNKYKIPQ